MTREFSIRSSDGLTDLHVCEWIPEGEIKGTVQLVHGMVEHISRYERFAAFLIENGYAVVGHDQLGHGETVKKEEDAGYIGKPDGNRLLVEDIHLVREYIEKSYEGKPHFLFGHSMGSFLSSDYITMYGEGLSGVVLSGTGYQSPLLLTAGLALTNLIALFRTDRYRSKFMNNIALGSNNKKFDPARTPFDWLTKDEEIVDRYAKDPMSGFVFTLNGFKALFGTIRKCQAMSRVRNIPKDLRILFVSGEDDPVGDFGEGVRKKWESYQKAGLEDLHIILYENDRHEILNELDYEDVQKDILEWIEDKS